MLMVMHHNLNATYSSQPDSVVNSRGVASIVTLLSCHKYPLICWCETEFTWSHVSIAKILSRKPSFILDVF